MLMSFLGPYNVLNCTTCRHLLHGWSTILFSSSDAQKGTGLQIIHISTPTDKANLCMMTLPYPQDLWFVVRQLQRFTMHDAMNIAFTDNDVDPILL